MMSTNTFTIKQWAEEDRPREKMLHKGVKALSNAELLALLLGSGSRTLTAVDLSKQILSSVDNKLNLLAKKTITELVNEHKGVGEAKAVTMLASMELARRFQLEQPEKLTQVHGSHSVVEYFRPLLADLPHEEFWVLYLNRANKILGSERVSQGGVSSTVVDMKLIFKPAIEKLSPVIILCHNHPSGNLKPSSQDIAITKKSVAAGKTLNVDVIDHVIISPSGSYSFADEGLMP